MKKDDWRRENVNEMIRDTYDIIKVYYYGNVT